MLAMQSYHADAMAIKSLKIEEDTETIESRFGPVAVSRDQALAFPRGLLGMPGSVHYALCEFPNEKFRRFKLLQSLDDHALSFITLPMDMSNAIFAPEDLITACDDLGIALKDATLLLIVSVDRSTGQTVISVNARAPLLIDTHRRLASQYVFTHDKYQAQHVIS
jgi:flagellar assembly factor FliW